MAVLVYASEQDLANWTQAANPPNAAALLRSASILVRQVTRVCWYAADSVTNLPTDPTTLQSFKDATCAQCAFWIANNIDPEAILAPGQAISTKKIGTAQISYNNVGAGSASAYQMRVDAATTLCEEAFNILSQEANLQLNGVWVIG